MPRFRVKVNCLNMTEIGCPCLSILATEYIAVIAKNCFIIQDFNE